MSETISRPFTFVKDGVFYFSRRIPNELKCHYRSSSDRVLIAHEVGQDRRSQSQKSRRSAGRILVPFAVPGREAAGKAHAARGRVCLSLGFSCRSCARRVFLICSVVGGRAHIPASERQGSPCDLPQSRREILWLRHRRLWRQAPRCLHQGRCKCVSRCLDRPWSQRQQHDAGLRHGSRGDEFRRQ